MVFSLLNYKDDARSHKHKIAHLSFTTGCGKFQRTAMASLYLHDDNLTLYKSFLIRKLKPRNTQQADTQTVDWLRHLIPSR